MAEPLFQALALTLYPEMFPGPLGQSLAGKALRGGIWSLETLQIRDFATDKHKTVDASPYGGGSGMVLKPDVVDAAVCAAKARLPGARVLYPSPRGRLLTQEFAEEMKNQKLIFVCGRFEGLDERVIAHHQMLEFSLGDFVLSGGEIAALALMDACVRLLPGVMGKEDSAQHESFSLAVETHEKQAKTGKASQNAQSPQESEKFAGLLEYPHYTRPPIWNGLSVPDILLSGDHEKIKRWRLEQAKNTTRARRPDLVKKKDERP